jgi:NAD(P)-dependent dehydrogenase (short-subunit alcohol dehydrogenase family)
MIKNGIRGSIINISSVHSERHGNVGVGIYGGLKAAVNRVAASFALELAPYGIRVNCISPGACNVRTAEEYRRDGASEADIEDRNTLGQKIPMRRLGRPRDIGLAVVWLASRNASYITGINVRVDGGLHLMRMPTKDITTSANRWSYICLKTPEEMKDW